MTGKPFHVGFFLAGSNAQAWNGPWNGDIGHTWSSPDLYVDIAKSMERAAFEFMVLEDTTYVPDQYGDNSKIYAENAISLPRVDPNMMAAILAYSTKNIGILPTVSTFAYHPYLLARQLGSLDLMSNGRSGWNLVTGSSDRGVQNFGDDGQDEHDNRYDTAGDFVDLANAMWDSWEPDAIVADRETGVFADHKKIHRPDYVGKTYRSRGPLITGPLPQGRPVLCQAGSSPRGQDFAVEYADIVIGRGSNDIGAMKSFRDSVRSRAVKFGRDPDSIKVVFIVSPVLGESPAHAAQRAADIDAEAMERPDLILAQLSKMTNLDLSVYPVDEPLPDAEYITNGTQSAMTAFLDANKGRTLREAAAAVYGRGLTLQLVGTPDAVAQQMVDVMAEIGGDGFVIGARNTTRRTIAEITDGLMPELQRLGVTRDRYTHAHLRDNLLEY